MTKTYYSIIDTTSPFFMEYHCSERVNWSKVPYQALERKGKIHKKTHKTIRKNFKEYVEQVKSMGYNSLSIDDLSHITLFSFYPDPVKKKIRQYRKRFKKLFQFAEEQEMNLFLTTDVMFSDDFIRAFSKNSFQQRIKLLKKSVEKALIRYPQLTGIIFRMGESDGQDVECDFKSRMILKTPRQVNSMIRELLPVFEKHQRKMIFRTWTTGAYKIGDIMWNKKTFYRAFRGIKSDSFIVSLKYGGADFFRYLKLSPFFNDTRYQKIMELQTRREYEGFGEFPSFVGWDYEHYFKQIQNNPTVCGIHVWCQTGGWSSFKNYSFLKESSLWNELNTRIALDLFQNGLTVEESLARHTPEMDQKRLVRFLKYSDQVIKDLLYDPGMADQVLYFNKLRIPPQIHIFWDNVTLTNLILLFYRVFNKQPEVSIKKGYHALLLLRKMRRLADELGVSYDYSFQMDTFKILYLVRKVIYQKVTRSRLMKLYERIEEYHNKYQPGYRFTVHLGKKLKPRFYKLLFHLVIRKKSRYRLLDKILYSKPGSRLILLIFHSMKKNFPEFTSNQAMPLTTFLD